MPIMNTKTMVRSGISLIISGLRWLLWIAIVTYITIEKAELYLQKSIHHLALSAVFFLLANIQIGISRLLYSMNNKEQSRRLFYLSIFMICAGMIEFIDLGLDRMLTILAGNGYVYIYKLVCILEFTLGTLSTLLAGYSLDRFLILLTIKSRDLAD